MSIPVLYNTSNKLISTIFYKNIEGEIIYATDLADLHQRMAGHEWREVARGCDRTHARSAASVGDTEGLVEVEVADVCPDISGPHEADHGVHVRPVHVHLAAVGMHGVTDALDRALEDAVGAGIGDHQRRQVGSVLARLFSKIFGVDVALFVTADPDHAHAGHDGAGRVRSVGREGDKTDVPVGVTPALVIGPNDQEASQLALGPRDNQRIC